MTLIRNIVFGYTVKFGKSYYRITKDERNATQRCLI
jgi:hypothetical protein